MYSFIINKLIALHCNFPYIFIFDILLFYSFVMPTKYTKLKVKGSAEMMRCNNVVRLYVIGLHNLLE